MSLGTFNKKNMKEKNNVYSFVRLYITVKKKESSKLSRCIKHKTANIYI